MKNLLSILSALVIGASGSSLATIVNTTHETNQSQIVQKDENSILDQLAASIVSTGLQGVLVDGSSLMAGMPIDSTGVITKVTDVVQPALSVITNITQGVPVIGPQLSQIMSLTNLSSLVPTGVPSLPLNPGNNIVPFSLDIGTAKSLFNVVIANVPRII